MISPPARWRTWADLVAEVVTLTVLGLLSAGVMLSILLDWPAVDRWLIGVFHGL